MLAEDKLSPRMDIQKALEVGKSESFQGSNTAMEDLQPQSPKKVVVQGW